MADATSPIRGLPTKAVPLDYQVPPAQSFDLLAVRAIYDGAAAGSAFLPCVQILNSDGAVMVETVGDSVAAGGSADASFFPLRRQTGAAQSSTFGQTVLTVAAANTLRGYWRLGETAAPMADSSGWSGGPTPLTTSGAGAAPTFHITGALPFGQDDGAISLNGGAGTGQYLQNASAAVNTGINSAWTIAAWLNPTASAAVWIAGVYSNLANPGTGDAGWQMTARWTGAGVVVGVRRAIAGTYIAVGAAIPTGSWTFVVATYDAATLRLYTNGVLAGSFADARADTFNPYFNVSVGVVFLDPLFAVGRFLGGMDEIAVWGATLTLGQIQALYAAAQV